ncbi:putative pilin component [Caenibius tardaugens NBRC 16725]|uniref:Putative pilin component n=1 Tax=Caenibius tardaugens NBRC 16725 TaxID=1219035 RepID=U2Y5J8_9SPHN|nr:Flp family type IVb pilin [Caenibius tardaugens]AZI34866.1 Flp family type IVb pilin [Caenibius tardaugens NBRC 16725]GAD48396.1 putative pilin component [Caenibius tardaugens NBRC 16725]
MKSLNRLKQLLHDESGVTVIEYGLIVALICIAIMASLRNVADETNGLWAIVTKHVNTAMEESGDD